ncbi:hypothetical protein FPV67DRAFT_1668779 [Lyophyllum atratum]|nr:hypothetical protein FPV67DRAFT_1668779 [Lyophyllum atratum]
MTFSGLCRAQSRLAAQTQPVGFPNGLRATSNPRRVHVLAPGYQTTKTRGLIHGWTIAPRRCSSNSAIKHLISGTSPTSWLYDEPTQVQESPQLSNATLVSLVKEDKIGAADRLRLQLVERGVDIEHHPIYEQAAIANLRWADPEQCLAHFTTWFSLVPEYDQSNPPSHPGPFKEARRILIRSGSPSGRLPLILRFGIMCASKGYLQPMFDEILPIVVRFASADAGVRWLYDMERAAVQYQSTHYPREAEETARRYRNFAIEICCEAGWLDHAMSLVELERNFTLSNRTYTLLIQALEDGGRRDVIKTVERHMNYDKSRLNLGDLKSMPFNLSRPTADVTGVDIPQRSLPPSPVTRSTPHPGAATAHSLIAEEFKRTAKPVISRQGVAAQLRFFKSTHRTRTSPNPLQIIHFLSAFKTVGGSHRVIRWLRHRALSGGKHYNIAWMKAELRYHNNERNYAEVLRLYMTYFDTKLPLPGIFTHTLLRIAAQQQLCVRPAPFPKYVLRDRWLVLKPLIRLALGLPWPLATMQALYASYRAATRDVRTPNREAYEVLSTFVGAFGACGSPEDARGVLGDSEGGAGGGMPYLRQVETMAGVLAGAGRVEEAMGLLGRIEAGADDKRKGTRRGKGMRVRGYDGKVEVALPRLTTYGRMIEGFTAAGLLEPALEVERMMKMRFEYEYGVNKRLDGALKGLWALEMERALGQTSDHLSLIWLGHWVETVQRHPRDNRETGTSYRPACVTRST